ncbi:ribosome maturation protein RimP [Zymomonas mobilis]|uniref:ribosome maturation protein RimP n=1 Tax=Zymomonas mobilis TaxID=542 RepID=UPI0039ECE744
MTDTAPKAPVVDIPAITALVEPEVKALGLELVRIAMFGGKSDPTLQIMAERPDTRQIGLTECEALSRRLSEIFDEQDPIEDAYRLEVSSPGIDRPLTRRKDYQDWKGFSARIRLSAPIDGRKQFDGEIIGIDDADNVILDCPKVGQKILPFSAIERSKLLLTDALIAATQPLDSEGADQIVREG